MKDHIVAMAMNGSGVRDTARVLGISEYSTGWKPVEYSLCIKYPADDRSGMRMLRWPIL
jgi:hypothetical protein